MIKRKKMISLLLVLTLVSGMFMQAFFPFFVEEKLIFVIGKINRESYG